MPLAATIAYLIGYLPVTFAQAILIETITQRKRRVSVKILSAAYGVLFLCRKGLEPERAFAVKKRAAFLGKRSSELSEREYSTPARRNY